MTGSRIARWRDLKSWLPGHAAAWTTEAQLVPLSSFLERIVVPADHSDRTLADLNVIAKITFGGTLHIRTPEQTSGYKGPLFEALPGDLIFSKIRVAQGSLCVVPDEIDHLAVSAEYPVYRPDLDQVVPAFLNLLLRTPQFQAGLLSLTSGNTTKKRVRPQDIEALEVPLPEPEDQRKLVEAYLVAVAEAAALGAEASRVETTAIQVFESGLGLALGPDLPRMRSRVARWREMDRWSHEGALQASVSNSVGVGPLPLVRLGDVVADLRNGWSPQCMDRPAQGEEWGVLKVGAVSFGAYRAKQNKALPPDLFPVPTLEVQPGDVLIGRANVLRLVGACALVHKTPPRLMLCDKIFRVAFFPDSPILPEYLVEVAKTPSVRQQIEANATGTSPTMKNISKPALLDLLFPMPDDIEVQRGMVAALSAARESAARIRDDVERARDLAAKAFASALFG